LISRPDSIGALKPETRAAFDKIYTLHDMGLEQEEPDPTEDVGQPVAGARPEPVDLHAKLFVVEAGWDVTWLIGSANATDAAFFRRNVEFMVELKGRRSDIGIDEILGQDEENALLSVLRAYTVDEAEEPPDGDGRAERLANAVREWLLALEMQLEVEEKADEGFRLTVHATRTDHDAPSGSFAVACWPISLPSERGCALMPPSASPSGMETPRAGTVGLEAPVVWDISRLGLTSFIAFEVEAQVEDQKHGIRFTLNLPISGLPRDREDHIFCAILSNQEQFLRYLRILLADRDDLSATWAETLGADSRPPWHMRAGVGETPLLRHLMRALSRSPERIDHIAGVVDRLQRTSEGRHVLPEDFRLLWEAVKEARSELE
jgi:hypothetical protein